MGWRISGCGTAGAEVLSEAGAAKPLAAAFSSRSRRVFKAERSPQRLSSQSFSRHNSASVRREPLSLRRARVCPKTSAM